MKKKAILALAATVAIGMASCGNKGADSTEGENPENVEMQEPTEQDAEQQEAPEEVVLEEVTLQDAEASETAKAETPAQEYVTTPSGLKYKVLKQGNGKSPKATDAVTVHYEGKLLNGKVFDSSYARNQAATFPLNRVIPGWTEGVQLMKEGAIYEFYIPANLAYGERGAGADIPPNSDLIFKVELLKVEQ